MTTASLEQRRRHARRNARAQLVAREIVLWAGATVGAVCLLVAAVAVFAGITPLIFRSGSMSPEIPTGALALADRVPAGELRPGDVVSVERADGVRVTHRVVTATPTAGGVSLVIKGDANRVADPDPIVTADAVDRVFWSTPGLGFAVDEAVKPQYVFVVGTLFGMLAMIGFRRPRLEDEAVAAVDATESPEAVAAADAEEARVAVTGASPATPGPEPSPAAGRHRASSGVALALVAAAVVTALPAPVSTTAAFTDVASASASVATGTVLPPSSLTCTNTGVLLSTPRLDWTAPAAGGIVVTGYQVLRDGVVVATLAANVSTWTGTGTGLLTLGASNVYRLQAVGSGWVSTPTVGRTVNVALLSLTASCGVTVP